MTRSILCLLFLCSCLPKSHSQIYVDSSNNVGIGSNVYAGAKQYLESGAETTALKIFSESGAVVAAKHGIYANTSGNGNSAKYGMLNYTYQLVNEESYGIFNHIHNSGNKSHYGIYNQMATGGTGHKYGLYNDIVTDTPKKTYGMYSNIASNGTGASYGIYNKVEPGSGHTSAKYGIYTFVTDAGTGTSYGVSADIDGASGYAGFFMGDVYVSGTLHNPPSDERLKEDIADVESAISRLQQLQPKSYRYKASLKKLGLKTGKKHYGFLAQDIESVMPELVSEVRYPEVPEGVTEDEVAAEENEPGHPGSRPSDAFRAGETYKSIDYIGMIAFLTQAIKEQQAQIEALRQEVEELKR